MRFVAIGDCQTGHKTKYEGPERIYHAWSDVIKYELPGSVLVSRGYSGDVYQGMWKRWKTDVLDEKPDTVIVFGGINNFTGSLTDPNSAIQEVIKNMVASAKENGIMILLVAVQPFGKSKVWTEERQSWLETFNAWQKSFEQEGAIFVDAYTLLEDPKEAMALNVEYEACSPEDNAYGYHLNIPGHERLGKFIADILRKVGGTV